MIDASIPAPAAAGDPFPARSRPAVDVVVPFAGSAAERRRVETRLARLSLRPGDTVTIADNRARIGGRPPAGGEPLVRVLAAAGRPTPGFARNRGAAAGTAPWIVFLDADTEPAPDLLDRYFDPEPDPATALLAGGVRDEAVAPSAPGPARYAYLRRTLSQDRTLGQERWGFVQSVNLAVRRAEFDGVGGFLEHIRAAEDADLTFRVQGAGGQIERREAAWVVHHNRRSVAAFVRQAALHGAGAAWLGRHYAGALPARRRAGLLWWGIRWALRGAARAARTHERDELVLALYEPLWELSFEFGRSLPNGRRARRRSALAGVIRGRT